MTANPNVEEIWYQPPSDGVAECVSIAVAGGPKRYMRVWPGSPDVGIEWGHVLHGSAVQIYPRGYLNALVRHLYVDLGQSTGGPLHIVLDDGDVDDQWLAEDESRYAFLFDGRFEEYAQAGEDMSEGRRREIRDTCELILAELRRMSYMERTAAVRDAYEAAMEAR